MLFTDVLPGFAYLVLNTPGGNLLRFSPGEPQRSIQGPENVVSITCHLTMRWTEHMPYFPKALR
jgi:hypothetical protein